MNDPIRLGRYSLFAKLASGGMATVYLGRLNTDIGFGRTVAIKRLHPHLATEREFVSMFLDEARLAARINHPNVISTLDVVTTDGELFLVMDYVRGESLSALIRASSERGETIPVPIATACAIGLLNGLEAAHEATDEQGRPLDIVHRDVSPQNVVVGTDGVVRVLDFGIAKASMRLQSTAEGKLKGKLAYMSPEQIRGTTSRATDVYAAGVVLWETLACRRLYSADTEPELVLQVMEGGAPPPSRHNPEVPPEVDRITLRALAQDAAARYPTAREMADALDAALRPASAMNVAEWVQSLAGDKLAERKELVAQIEGGLPAPDNPALLRILSGLPLLESGARDVEPATTIEPAVQRGRAEAGRQRLLPLVPLGILAVVAVTFAWSLVHQAPPRAASPAPSASSLIADAAVATPLMALPRPRSAVPEAIIAWVAGLQAKHDAEYPRAERQLLRALTLDPSLASAVVRLMTIEASRGPELAREHYRHARTMRSMLTDREQAIVEAFEPYVGRDPADPKEHVARLRALSARYPGDAEISLLLGQGELHLGDFAHAIEAANRALGVDTDYVEAIALRALARAYEADFDGAAADAERCLKTSPAAPPCRWIHTEVAVRKVGCAALEADARSWITYNPDYPRGYRFLAATEIDRESPRSVIDELATQAGERDSETGKLATASAAAVARGDFGEGERLARTWLASVTSADAMEHGLPALALAEILEETGRGAQAAEVALGYLSRQSAWTRSTEGEDIAVNNDATPEAVGIALAAGRLTLEQARRDLGIWSLAWKKRLPAFYAPYLWSYGWARAATTPASAHEAVAALATFGGHPALFTPFSLADADVGRTYLEANKPDDALPYLERAAHSCEVLDSPVRETRAIYDLALAHASHGETEEACASLHRVLGRWGSARTSITAGAARKKAEALGCGKGAPG